MVMVYGYSEILGNKQPLAFMDPKTEKHHICADLARNSPKKLANDMDEVHMPGTTTEQYKRNFLKEASKWDYLISPNAYSTEILEVRFSLKKHLLNLAIRETIFYIKKIEMKKC